MTCGLILCEGKTDAILVSYFLCKTLQYKFQKKAPLKIKDVDQVNESINWYENDKGRMLAIWGVGGYSNLPNALDQIEKLNRLQFTFDKIAIIRDKDTEVEA